MQQTRIHFLHAPFKKNLFYLIIPVNGQQNSGSFTLPESSGPFTVKTRQKKPVHLPFTLLPYGLFAGITVSSKLKTVQEVLSSACSLLIASNKPT